MRSKYLLTTLYFVVAGIILGVLVTVVTRAAQEIQQQLGNGAAPSVLALLVKLLYTSLSLLAGAADAVVAGALGGAAVGLVMAVVYLGYRGWRRRQLVAHTAYQEKSR